MKCSNRVEASREKASGRIWKGARGSLPKKGRPMGAEQFRKRADRNVTRSWPVTSRPIDRREEAAAAAACTIESIFNTVAPLLSCDQFRKGDGPTPLSGRATLAHSCRFLPVAGISKERETSDTGYRRGTMWGRRVGWRLDNGFSRRIERTREKRGGRY